MLYAPKQKLNEMTNHGYPGLLIVVEGTDGSGRTTQIELLREWLTVSSYGVMVSEWNTSSLMSEVIAKSKEGNLLNANTFSLLYASDFAARLENDIIPALKAGFVILADRYIYTAFARDVVRGVSPKWVRQLYSFAPEPDLIFNLQVSLDGILERIIASSGLDYYESGRDIGLSTDFYESFKIYQRRVLAEYTKMTEEYNFITINGMLSVNNIQSELRKHISDRLSTGVIN